MFQLLKSGPRPAAADTLRAGNPRSANLLKRTHSGGMRKSPIRNRLSETKGARFLRCPCEVDKKGSSSPETRVSVENAKVGGILQFVSPYWAYTTLMFLSALLGAVLLVKPLPLLQLLTTDNISRLDVSLLKLVGSTVIINGIVEYCLQDAVNRKMLDVTLVRETYQTLLLSATARQLGMLVLVTFPPGTGHPMLLAVLGGPALLALSVHLPIYRATFAAQLPAAQDLLWRRPRTLVSWGYLALAGVYFLKAAACLTPGAIFPGGYTTLDVLLQRCCIPGYLLACMVALVLRQCEDRERLGTQMAKTLTLGLAGVELTHRTIFGSAMAQGLIVMDVSSYANISLSVAIAVFCASQYYLGR